MSNLGVFCFLLFCLIVGCTCCQTVLNQPYQIRPCCAIIANESNVFLLIQMIFQQANCTFFLSRRQIWASSKKKKTFRYFRIAIWFLIFMLDFYLILRRKKKVRLIMDKVIKRLRNIYYKTAVVFIQPGLMLKTDNKRGCT